MLNLLTWAGSFLVGSPYTKWIFLVLLVAAAGWYAYHLAYSNGQKAVEIKAATRVIEVLSSKVKIDAEIHSLPRAARRERLRKYVIDPPVSG